MMTLRAGILIATLVFMSHANTAGAGPEAEAWYRDAYAPLWAVGVSDRLDKVVPHFSETLLVHEADGGYRLIKAADWLQPALSAWGASGWLGSELTSLSVQHVNATTALFRAHWRDVYADGSEEITCGLYLAGQKDGRWLFTGYFDTDCGDVGGG